MHYYSPILLFDKAVNLLKLISLLYLDLYLPILTACLLVGITMLLIIKLMEIDKLGNHYKNDLKKYKEGNWVRLLKGILTPSIGSISILLIVGLIFLGLSLKYDVCQNVTSTIHWSPIGVLTGASVILFSLFIFVANELREDKDGASVLLMEGKLYPLTTLVILCFLIIIRNCHQYISVGMVVIIGLLIINSIYSILRVILDNDLMQYKKNELVKMRLRKAFKRVLERKFALFQLRKWIKDNNLKIDFYSIGTSETTYKKIKFDINIESHQIAYVYDIRLDVIKKLYSIIDKYCKSNSDKNREYCEPHLVLLKQTQDRIYEGGDTILLFRFKNQDQELTKSDIRTINNLAKKAIRIKITHKSHINESRDSLGAIRDGMIKAIMEKKLTIINNYRDSYLDVIKEFLGVLKTYGGYDSKKAKDEQVDTAFGMSWDTIRQLNKDLEVIQKIAIDMGDTEIIRNIAYLAKQICDQAIEIGDHFIFQTFIRLPAYLYFYSEDIENKSLKMFLENRSWSYYVELADYTIASELKDLKEEDATRAKELIDFGKHLYSNSVFPFLMVRAYKKNDINNFRIFTKEANKLFRTDLGSRRDSDLFKDIKERKLEIFYWLASMIISDVQGNSDRKIYFETVNNLLPNIPKDIREIFVNCWRKGWSAYSFEEHEAGVVYGDNTVNKMCDLFCIKMLKFLSTLNDKELDVYKIEDVSDIKDLLGLNGYITTSLNDIKNNQEKWKNLLGENELELADQLLSKLDDAYQEQVEIKKEKIRNMILPEPKAVQFRDVFYKHYDEAESLKDLIKKYGKYEHKVGVHSKFSRILASNRINKEFFIDEDEDINDGLCLQQAESYINFENSCIIDKTFKILKKKHIKPIKSKEDLIKILKGIKLKGRNIIAISTLSDPRILREMEQHNLFIPYYREKSVITPKFGYTGRLITSTGKIPIYRFSQVSNNLKNRILIIQLKKALKLSQYSPLSLSDKKEYQRNEVSLKLSDLNAKKGVLQRMLTRFKLAGKKLMEARKVLRGEILIEICQKFKLEKLNTENSILMDFDGFKKTSPKKPKK